MIRFDVDEQQWKIDCMLNSGNQEIPKLVVFGYQRSTTKEPGETGRGRGGHRGMQTHSPPHTHTHTHTHTNTHTHTHIT